MAEGYANSECPDCVPVISGAVLRVCLAKYTPEIPVFGDTSVVAQIITRLAKIFLLSSAVVGDPQSSPPDHVQWSILGTWTRTTTAD